MDTTDNNGTVHDEQFRKPEEASENTNENVNPNEESPSLEEDKKDVSAENEEPKTNETNVSEDNESFQEEEASELDETAEVAPEQTSSEEVIADAPEVSEKQEEEKPEAEEVSEPVVSEATEKEETVIDDSPEMENKEESEIPAKAEVKAEPKKTEEETNEEEKPETEEVSEPVVSETSEKEEAVTDDSPEIENKEESGTPSEVEVKAEPEKTEEEKVTEEVSANDETEVEANKEETSEKQESDTDEKEEVEFDETVDYSSLNKDQLVEELSKIIAADYKPKNRDLVEEISTRFYELHNEDIEKIKEKFLEDGGVIEDFKVESDPVEENLRGFVQRHRERKSAFYQQQEEIKKKNLEEKFRIIDEIESLINKEESLNQTFHEFNELQTRWKEIGLVPQKSLKEMWDSYHYTIEKFYDYIKINKELRDLDFKKNQEAKILLCEKAEELLLEPNIINAFRILQTLHDQWREVGPVPQSMRNELWERFKEATSKINKKHQEYFHNLKDEQKKNLEQKTVLCEKAEEINKTEVSTLKEWDQKADELKELQKIWKTIGFAPKKDNNAIYERFRNACDAFFDKKRDFFSKNREEQNNNLQLKIDLCIQAEGVKDSTDWKKTTDELIALQKKWKTIGPVPRKQSDQVWKRFRAACDEFFNRKGEHFSTIDTEYEDNLKKKEALIEEVMSYTISDNAEEALSKLKSFQRQYTEIGYVPIKQKDEIQKKFREAINEKFDQLELDDQKKNMIKFRSKVDEMIHAPKGYSRLRQDREKLINKLKQLENDIVLWENNIGFFANSKNAQSMIHEVERKIEDAKKKIEGLHEKIRLIEDKLDE